MRRAALFVTLVWHVVAEPVQLQDLRKCFPDGVWIVGKSLRIEVAEPLRELVGERPGAFGQDVPGPPA